MDEIPDGMVRLPGAQSRIVRTAEEIQKAHDQLEALLLGKTPSTLGPVEKMAMENELKALCWLLGHPGGQLFEQELAAYERLTS